MAAMTDSKRKNENTFDGMKNVSEMSKKEKADLLESIDVVLTDCDGVLWTGDGLINGSLEVLNELHKCGKKVFYITNNSTKTTAEYSTKLHSLGFAQYHPLHILNTAALVAQYLQHELPAGKSVHVLGSNAVRTELQTIGLQVFSEPDGGEILSSMMETAKQIKLKKDVGAVVVGFDTDFNYVKLTAACSYLRRDPSCLFVATNTDAQFPGAMGSDLTFPGTGTMVMAVQVGSSRPPPVVVGKPSGYVKKLLLQRLGADFNPDRTLMIGDRLDTDILFGNRCGFRTLLVLSGVHQLQHAAQFAESTDSEARQYIPHYYSQCLAHLQL